MFCTFLYIYPFVVGVVFVFIVVLFWLLSLMKKMMMTTTIAMIMTIMMSMFEVVMVMMMLVMCYICTPVLLSFPSFASSLDAGICTWGETAIHSNDSSLMCDCDFMVHYTCPSNM